MENRGSEDPHYKSGRGRDKIQEGRCLFCRRGDGAVRPEWYALEDLAGCVWTRG